MRKIDEEGKKVRMGQHLIERETGKMERDG